MVREHTLSRSNLVMPLFVMDGKAKRVPVKSMPGIWRFSIDQVVRECKELNSLGIQAIALFPVIKGSIKDKTAQASLAEDGLYARAIRAIKKKVPPLTVISLCRAMLSP